MSDWLHTSSLLTLITALTVTLDPRTAETAQSNGINKLGWQHLCTTSNELDELPAEILQGGQGILHNTAKLAAESTRAQIYLFASAPEDEWQKVATPAAYMAAKAEKSRQHYESTDLAKQFTAATAATYLKGRLDEFLSIASATSEGANGDCIVSDNDNAVVLGSTPQDGITCKMQLSSVSPKRRTTTNIQPNGITSSPPTSNTGNQHQHASRTCKLFNPKTSGLSTNGNLAQKIPYAGGYYATGTSGAAELSVADTKDINSLSQPEVKPWKDALASLKGLPQASDEQHRNETNSLETSALAAEIIGRAISNKAGQNSEQIKKEREGIFTEKSATVAYKLLGKIHDYELPAAVAGQTVKTKLGAITDQAELQALLMHFTLRKLQQSEAIKQQLNEAVIQATHVNAAGVCNKIKDATECNNNPICSYNESTSEVDKKCQFNETKVKANNVPVTQAQTAGGTTAPSDRCTKHKDKANCEKENEGQKPGEKAHCGWIEEKCKDSAFHPQKEICL
ncbi:variant surface glycoprotein (VSG), putative [Trypanosoma brucei gambiense DAL972]|uniref:Variant surface glycoprotein (VSG), putative n=2 Tax=Trypanosoma brucei TaxID=5691 RepID=C9ZX49_TRYB9|nr:variant surface glycoprotein (VSG), putative [Trypanosoma brucei gambiense DAL972]CBH13991.1 variant surface glycoprotein (VSG), putative [Trypanosoma brucei gambiense DAL972]|eukprot:XP_011776264.1 variant surface glycoprotein (VSG), putative [Trypanosoma brucei gambiense DAL972]